MLSGRGPWIWELGTHKKFDMMMPNAMPHFGARPKSIPVLIRNERAGSTDLVDRPKEVRMGHPRKEFRAVTVLT